MQRFKKAFSIILAFVYVFTALPLTLSGKTGTIQAFAEEVMTDEQCVDMDCDELDALAETEGWENPDGIETRQITLSTEGTDGSVDENLEADKNWLTAEMILGDNSDADNISKRLNLPKAGPNLSTISWSFSEEDHPSAGAVMRPAGGDKP